MLLVAGAGCELVYELLHLGVEALALEGIRFHEDAVGIAQELFWGKDLAHGEVGLFEVHVLAHDLADGLFDGLQCLNEVSIECLFGLLVQLFIFLK